MVWTPLKHNGLLHSPKRRVAREGIYRFCAASFASRQEGGAMQVVYPCCRGLDVHKKSITACVLWAEARGEKRKEKRVFGTFTRDLLKLSDWLRECSVRQVAFVYASHCASFGRCEKMERRLSEGG